MRRLLHPALSRHSRGVVAASAPLLRLSSSSPTASCPFSGGETATAATTTESRTCPIMGTTAPPNMACPIEEPTATPTFASMASQLGKAKLSGFVTATAVAGYVVAGGTSPAVMLALTAGTMLQSCSANVANQIIEVEHDKNMKRTCRRPLPMGHITVRGAALLSGAQLATGTALLAVGASPAAAALGLANWATYVCGYTPLKRVSAVNTWFGSIVGGVPPLMGGAAAPAALAAAAATASPYSLAAVSAATLAIPSPALLLGAFMLAWQIPHFMALSFHCRRDYEGAGYKMLAFANPWRASAYAVGLSVAMAGITIAGPFALGIPVEAAWYVPVTVGANATMIYKSWRFHQDPVRYCRGCFVFSYLYLAVMLVAFMLNHAQPVATATALIEQMIGTNSAVDSTATAAASA